MIPSAAQASAFLDALLAGLYAHAPGASMPAPVPVIDDPATARHVLSHPDRFVKNYGFLEDLGRGRFSSNGEDWRRRAALTRPWYRNAHRALAPQQVREIYARHLAGGGALDAPALFRRFCAAAVEVFARAIGLPAALAWPDEIVDPIRTVLKVRQWIDWNGCLPRELAAVQADLAHLREVLRERWHATAEGRTLLAALSAGGADIAGFDAAQELAQNILAASETTASSLLWATESLSRQPQMQQALAADPAGLDRYIAEVLRMFPPVPYLTRRCVADSQHAGWRWQAGAVLSISVVGIHRHPDHWHAPWEFDSGRPEYDAGATPYAYMPFSRGERVCAGMRLAQVELRAGLEALLAGRRCVAGAAPTGFCYGLSSQPRSALRAVPLPGKGD